MPFKSDKQRRYLWSQKPEVAKEVAHKAKGGPLSTTLRLGDDASDAIRAANLKRIQESGANLGRGRTSTKRHERTKPYTAKGVLDTVTDFVPGVGEAKDVYRAGSNIASGNYGAAALDLATAGVGLVPGIGDAAAAGIRGVRSAGGKAADKVRNYHGFERAQERLPDLIPNQTVWNSVHEKALKGDIEIGDVTRRDRRLLDEGADPGQLARNASVNVDGKQVPVVVVPHKNPKVGKYHIITVRDRGRKGDQTGVLGGREYERGGTVGGK